MSTPTTAVADRAEIEALARELDDGDWSHVFAVGVDWTGTDEVCGCTMGPNDFAALLAYLDSVWAGLGSTSRDHLASTEREGEAVYGGIAYPLRRAQLVYRDAARWWHSTPLGRAVLRRAKEQGK